MMVPLLTGGKTIGLIKIESQDANFFDESDLEILELLAFQVASAIEHARLLQRTREIAIVEERTRLAREMHDGIAQNLAYLRLQVDRSLEMVEEDSRLAVQLEGVHGLLQQNIDELRRNIFDLRPVELEGKSLFAALENFVAEFGRRWRLQTTCVVKGELPVELSPETESALYRILQESLSNAQQHACCRQLTVSLAVEDKRWINLAVQDDGLGFESPPTAEPLPGKGLGLVSMRERAHTAGGHLTVESNPGQGTRVEVKLPLRRELK
jgi:signal transduction histidine kinase